MTRDPAWIVGAHTLDLPATSHAVPPGTTTVHIVLATFQRTPYYIGEMIGDFGYLDTPAPIATYIAMTGVIAFLFVAGVLAGVLARQTRRVVVLFCLGVATVVVPVILSVPEVHRQGYGWQGRYGLPLAVGVILASAAIADQGGLFRRFPRRTAGALLIALAAGQFLAFGKTLRRYTVGLAGTLDLLRGTWQPPLGDIVVLLWYLMALVALVLLVFGLASRRIEKTQKRSPPVRGVVEGVVAE